MTLVHKEVFEHALEPPMWPGDRAPQTAATCTAYFVKPGKVSKVRSIKLTGLNKHTGSRYYRWQNTNAQTYYLKKNGKIAGRVMSVGATPKSKSFFGTLSFYTVQNDERLRDILTEQFGEVTFNTVYPLAAHYGMTTEEQIPPGLRPSFQADDLRQLVEVTFGKTRYRRDIARAAAQTHPDALAFARAFRGLVPVDWLADFMRRHPKPEAANDQTIPVRFGLGIKDIRPHLLQLDPRSYRALLRNTTLDRATRFEIEDMSRVAPVNRRVRTINELHDAVFEHHRQGQRRMYRPLGGGTYVAPEVSENIIVPALGEALDGIFAGDLSIQIGRDEETLRSWGDEMRNCIGSYGYSMKYKTNQKVLGGVYRSSKLLANFEVDHGELRQLLGKANSVLPAKDRTVLEDMFRAFQVKVDKNYWGAHDQQF